MGITGEKFLELNETVELCCTRHALDRLEAAAGRVVCDRELSWIFLRAKQLSPDEMNLLGYLPNFTGRKERGESSWYFGFHLDGVECVAVIARKHDGPLFWKTTYSQSPQSRNYRVVDFEDLAAVA